MKKLLFAGVMLAAILLTACTASSKTKCYELTTESDDTIGIIYYWCNEAEIKAHMAEAEAEYLKETGKNDLKISYKAVSKSQSDCSGITSKPK